MPFVGMLFGPFQRDLLNVLLLGSMAPLPTETGANPACWGGESHDMRRQGILLCDGFAQIHLRCFAYIYICLCVSVCLCMSLCMSVCPVLSCPVLSCPVLSCPVLSCPVLSVCLSVKELASKVLENIGEGWTAGVGAKKLCEPC